MLAKIKIKSELEILTGLHIGGNSAFAAIGAVDSPVIKDTLTMEPIIPGSSLKGKMRSLLAKKYNTNKCVKDPKDDEDFILRLFGKAKLGKEKAIESRLQFFDIFLKNKKELRDRGVESFTEVKFENNINRITAKADPRQIERVIRGTKFEFQLIYNILNEEEIEDDLKIVYDGIKLLEEDYLGGSGTRGYGRIKFNDFKIELLSSESDIKEKYESKVKNIFGAN